MKIDFRELVGSGYRDALGDTTHRYICLSGSRASGKSTFTHYKALRDLLINENANILYVRNTYRTLEDSCYANFKKILTDPSYPLSKTNLIDFFVFKKSPLRIEFWRDGVGKGEPQLILFRGMDNPDKLQSIAVAKGYIKTVIIDEAHEIQDEIGFDKLDFSIRGYSNQQFIICQNMYSMYHWVYQRFYKRTPDNALALIKNFEHNDFLTRENNPEFFIALDNLKNSKPKQYAIYTGKEWGGSDKTVFAEEDYDIRDIEPQELDGLLYLQGLDWGFVQDPVALVDCYIDKKNKKIFIPNLLYKTGLLNSDIAPYIHTKTVADCAEPKSIAELNKLQQHEVVKCRKGADSIMHGIRLMKEYKMYISPNCEPLIAELQRYEYNPETHKPIDKFNHAIDAIRYVVGHIERGNNKPTSVSLKEIRKGAKK
jgi:phage terminase large subunit